MTRPPLPPFTEQTARTKVQAAEDAWNTRDPQRVALAYTADSVWRNRDEFLTGRDEARARHGADFDLKAWHRSVLDLGPLGLGPLTDELARL